jgi:hypothetical protein
LLFVEVLQVSDGPFSLQQAVQEINEEHLSFRFPKDSFEAPIGERRYSLLHIFVNTIFANVRIIFGLQNIFLLFL